MHYLSADSPLCAKEREWPPRIQMLIVFSKAQNQCVLKEDGCHRNGHKRSPHALQLMWTALSRPTTIRGSILSLPSFCIDLLLPRANGQSCFSGADWKHGSPTGRLFFYGLCQEDHLTRIQFHESLQKEFCPFDKNFVCLPRRAAVIWSARILHCSRFSIKILSSWMKNGRDLWKRFQTGKRTQDERPVQPSFTPSHLRTAILTLEGELIDISVTSCSPDDSVCFAAVLWNVAGYKKKLFVKLSSHQRIATAHGAEDGGPRVARAGSAAGQKGVSRGAPHTTPSHNNFTTPGGSTSDPGECLRMTDRPTWKQTSGNL